MRNLLFIVFLLIPNILWSQEQRPCVIYFSNYNGGKDFPYVNISIQKSNGESVSIKHSAEEFYYYFEDIPLNMKLSFIYQSATCHFENPEWRDDDDDKSMRSMFLTQDGNVVFEWKLTKLILSHSNGDNLCMGDDLLINSSIPLPFNVFFFKNRKRVEVQKQGDDIIISSREVIIDESDYGKKLELNMVSDKIVNVKDGSEVTLSSTITLPAIYPYAELEKNGKVIVENNYLKVPELENTNQSIVLNSILGGQVTDIKEDFNLGKCYGQYQVFLQETGKCSVVKTLIYPELEYNYVNNKNDSCTFWFPGQAARDSAVFLNFMYTKEDNAEAKENIKEYLKVNGVSITNAREDIAGIVDVQNAINAEIISTDSCFYLHYPVAADESLDTIYITSTNPNFIPVKKSVTLNSYQKINVADVEVKNPTCYYDNAEVNIGIISEGLKGSYKCAFETNDKIIDTTIQADGGIIKIAPSAFGGGQRNVNFVVYDDVQVGSDTTGLKARSFTKNLTLNYPDRLSIDNVEKKDLLCHNDNSGEIHIKEFSPKDGNYTFAIRNDDYSIESMDATGLKASDYQLIIENEKGCKNDSLKITINQPDTLDIENLVVKNPKCFGYSDGYINYDVTGGTGEKSFVWNDGFTEKDRDEIPVGEYSVTITDRNKCKITKQMTLTQPTELNNYFTGDYKICTGSSLTIDSKKYDSTDVFKEFLWLDENSNIYSQEQILQFDSTNCGKYILISFDEKKYDNARKDGAEIQCHTTDTLNISMSSERFDKSFLVASQSYFGDTIVLVNDTKNDDFDFKFEIPEELEEIGIQDKFYDYIVASKPGVYSLIMSIKGDDCTANEYREIEILNEIRPEDYDEQFVKTVQIVSMKMGPNPNDGNFTFDLVMTEKSDVSLSLYSISRPRLLRKDELKDNNKYSKEYNENLPVGEYMLLVRTENDNKVIKFIVSE